MRIGWPATTMAVALLLTTFVSAGTAAPITYSEAVSGDLGSSLPASTVFALDAGVNTVSGTFAFTLTGGLERDSFAVSVPVGMELTGISLAFTTTLAGTTTIAEMSFILDDGNVIPSFPFPGFDNIDVLGTSPVNVFTSALPVGTGTYGIFHNGGQIFGTGFTADYTWSMTVAPTPVPEPASLVLLGSGLCGVLVRRYRQQRRPPSPVVS